MFQNNIVNFDYSFVLALKNFCIKYIRVVTLRLKLMDSDPKLNAKTYLKGSPENT